MLVVIQTSNTEAQTIDMYDVITVFKRRPNDTHSTQENREARNTFLNCFHQRPLMLRHKGVFQLPGKLTSVGLLILWPPEELLNMSWLWQQVTHRPIAVILKPPWRAHRKEDYYPSQTSGLSKHALETEPRMEALRWVTWHPERRCSFQPHSLGLEPTCPSMYPKHTGPLPVHFGGLFWDLPIFPWPGIPAWS